MSIAFWLSTQPPVLYCVGYPEGVAPAWLDAEPRTLIITMGGCTSAHELRALADRFTAQFARHTVLLAVSDFKVAARSAHRAVICVPEHVVLNASFWDISPTTTRYYDAVLVGQVEPHKRHGLAAAVPRLCCVAPTYHGAIQHAQNVRRQLHAAAFPFEPGRRTLGSRELLLGLYQQSHAGLLLSGVEACSRAAGEQQLCGLPLVSCGNHAGSLSCADPDFIRIVAPTPAAVAAAVADVVAAQYDPVEIRDAFLARVNQHRRRLEERLGCVLNWCSYPEPPRWLSDMSEWPVP